MKNNKGFSTIELVVSFSICMVVVVILFQIVISLKELYEKSAIKTEILNKRNLIVNQIYTDIYEKGLDKVNKCGLSCAEFTYNDGTDKKLEFSDSKLSYGDYTTSISNISSNNEIIITTVGYDYLQLIELPIKHNLFDDEDFGIKIIYYLYYY